MTTALDELYSKKAELDKNKEILTEKNNSLIKDKADLENSKTDIELQIKNENKELKLLGERTASKAFSRLGEMNLLPFYHF